MNLKIEPCFLPPYTGGEGGGGDGGDGGGGDGDAALCDGNCVFPNASFGL